MVSPTVEFSIAGINSNISPGEIPVVSKQIEINIDAKDERGISKVEAFINDVKVGEDTSAPFKIVIDISSYTSKASLTGKYESYTLKVVATDLAGNSSSAEQQISIDNEMPSISEVSLQENTVINGATNIITFSVSDNEEISSVTIYINDNLITNIDDGNYELNLDTLELIDGRNTLRIEAKDPAENMGNYIVNFISDNTGPEISMESIVENQILDAVTGLDPQVSDKYTTIASFEILLGETSLVIFDETATSYQFDFDCTQFPTGANNLIFIAKDKLENESRTEIPIEIYRRLITINFPPNFFDPQLARIFVFASSTDGKVLDVERVFQETEQIYLRTINDLEADSEFSLTFAEFMTGAYGNWAELTTLQNLKPSNLDILNLKTEPRFEYGPTQPSSFPIIRFDPDDIVSGNAHGFGYGVSVHRENERVVVDRRRNTTSEVNTDYIYIWLYNYTLSEYSYLIEDWNLPADYVLDKNRFTQDGIERRMYKTSLGPGDYSSVINITGYFNENDFQNNIFHQISNAAYGFSAYEGSPYYYNTNMHKTVYEFTMPGYHTSRVGEPLEVFQDLDWTLDYSINGKKISIDKTGAGHYVGKVYLGTDPPEIINGLNVGYGWNLIFNSETSNEVILPEIPEELQTWGFYDLYKNDNLKILQAEIKRYEGISSYDDYLTKVIKNNNFIHTITPVMESKFIRHDQLDYYIKVSNFLLD